MKRGTVVLTPFPFTDLTGNKVRPALVVSRSDRSGQDVLLAFITSRLNLSPSRADLSLDSTHPDFTQTGLKVSSRVKLDKLVTVERSVILGELGVLSPVLMQEVDKSLKYALELEAQHDDQA